MDAWSESGSEVDSEAELIGRRMALRDGRASGDRIERRSDGESGRESRWVTVGGRRRTSLGEDVERRVAFKCSSQKDMSESLNQAGGKRRATSRSKSVESPSVTSGLSRFD
jgi:hypothetical protein